MNILGASLDTLVLAEGSLPVQVEIYLAMRVSATMQEWQQSGHQLTTRVLGPDGKHCGSEHRIVLWQDQAPMVLAPGSVAGQLFALPHDLVITAAGSYCIEVALNAVKRACLRIAARQT
jgi:hypothetical protein